MNLKKRKEIIKRNKDIINFINNGDKILKEFNQNNYSTTCDNHVVATYEFLSDYMVKENN